MLEYAYSIWLQSAPSIEQLRRTSNYPHLADRRHSTSSDFSGKLKGVRGAPIIWSSINSALDASWAQLSDPRYVEKVSSHCIACWVVSSPALSRRRSLICCPVTVPA